MNRRIPCLVRTDNWTKPKVKVLVNFFEVHNLRCRRNHDGQSLNQVHLRGGLSFSEAVAILRDHDWIPILDERAIQVVLDWVTLNNAEY